MTSLSDIDISEAPATADSAASRSCAKSGRLVSVIVPCRNEKDHIDACVQSILQQDATSMDLEVIVVDGMSTDGTRAILHQCAARMAGLRVVDNPALTTPSAMNIGIRAARGEYVAILGAHAVYASNYLQTCLDLLDEHPEVSCSGGPIVSLGTGPFGRAVAAVMSHRVGVGNATHRHPEYEGYAEGACYPLFRRNVFHKIGLFDESLIRNQDDEFNYRLARHGERVFISPRARCIYCVRETPAALFRQYFEYGFWRVAVLRKHRLPASVRQVIPPAFAFMAVTALLVGLWMGGPWRVIGVVLPVAYGTAVAVAATAVGRRAGWLTAVLFSVAAVIMHGAYAIGFSCGMLKGRGRRWQPLAWSNGGVHAPRT